ncbi:hypothetical protein [Yoonia sp. SS1-5]|uniref:Uncharacterized protein n=1 Tax=Yoonia rhodophyticola TaxID=3137370 RepID=A0AAN0NKW7_9RHOB
MKFWLTGVLFAALAACESTGDGGGGSTPLQIVDPASLPVTGAPTYTGTLNFVLNEGGAGDVTYTGDLSLTASFAGDTITGDVSNFTDSDAETYTGTLTLINGDIDRGAGAGINPVFADLDGSLTRASDAQVLESGAAIGGEFFGSAGAATPEEVRGTVTGSFCTENCSGGGPPSIVAVEVAGSTFTASQ